MKAPIQWFGGKGMMIKTLLPFLYDTKIYVEPYGGAGAVLFAKLPSPVEVYNDLNGDLVNLFKHLQNKETFEELQHRIRYTLYSYEEFGNAINTLKNPEASPMERAWAFFVACNQGFSGLFKSQGCWGRAFTSKRGIAHTTNSWCMRLSMLDDWHKRILTVQIDNRNALDVIKYWDSEDTTFYLDPPYIVSTRKSGGYQMEVDDHHHEELIQILLSLKGYAILSGYNHEIYQLLETNGWYKEEFKTSCYAAGNTRNSGLQGKGSNLQKVPRTEVIWTNKQRMFI